MSKQYTVTLTLPDGKRKYFRGSTRKEAERKRDEAKRLVDSGIDLSSSVKVSELAELWLSDYRMFDVRESTYITQKSLLTNHVLPAIGHLKVREVKPAHINHMLLAMKDKSKGTQKLALSITKTLFSFAVENDMILKNPCTKSVKPRGEDAQEKMPLTSEQEKMLLDKARGTCLYLFVLLGLNAGLRRGELLGLQWNDINFTDGTLSVRRNVSPTRANPNGELTTELKTPAARRIVPLPWSVVDDLRAAKSVSRSVFVIPNHKGSFFSISSFSYNWNKLVSELPFEVNPHLMRHTRITRWFEQGLDLKEVQYLAGHASLDMTLGTYTHYHAEERMQETARKIQAV